jgi:hypothetical protein
MSMANKLMIAPTTLRGIYEPSTGCFYTCGIEASLP